MKALSTTSPGGDPTTLLRTVLGAGVESEALRELAAGLAPRTLKRRALFGEDLEPLVGVVASGLVRKFLRFDAGSERSFAFYPEGALFCRLADADGADVAPWPMALLQAVEPSVVWTMSYAAFATVMERHPSLQGAGYELMKHYMLRRERRERDLMQNDSLLMYESLRRTDPALVARIPHKDIASYLGITPVSMSRLLKRRREAQVAKNRELY